MKKAFKQIGIALGAIVLFIVMAAAGVIGKDLAKRATKEVTKERNLEQLFNVLTKMANASNEKGPRAIDEYTQLDKISVERDAKMVYHYSLKISSDDVSHDWPDGMRKAIHSKICTNPDTRKLLTLGALHGSIYTTSDGVKALELEVKEKDCL